MKDKIKFEAEIYTTTTPTQVKIKAIEDLWSDFGYLLEIMASMSRTVMDYREMTQEQVVNYISNYLNRAIPDYKGKI